MRNTCSDKTEKDIARSITFYTKQIALDSSDQDAYYKTGMAYFKLQQIETSLTYFHLLENINPKCSGLYSNIALCKLLTQDKDGACEYFNKSIHNGEDTEIINGEKISAWVARECDSVKNSP